MFNRKNKNRLLQYFDLDSHSEILEYIKENPEDEKVKEIKELFKAHIINSDEEMYGNEK